MSVRDATTESSTRFLGLLQGDVPVKGPVSQLHQNIPATADRFMFTQPEADRAVLSSVTPNVPAQITLHRPWAEDSCLSISVPGSKEAAMPPASLAGYRTISTKSKVDHFRSRVCEAFAQHNTLNLFVNQLTILNTGGQDGNDTQSRAFIKLRDAIMEVAVVGHLRKLGGYIWRPIAGCPCAYEQAESYKDYLNKELDRESLYHNKPAYQRELLEYLINYNPSGLRDIEFDRNMLSFADGVLVASETEMAMRFESYVELARNPTLMKEFQSKVARHHIALPYAPPSSPTPLFDSLIGRQFSTNVAHTLWVLLGRLLFPVGLHDNWQVMAWLIGTAGTGKTVVQDIVAAMFASHATGTLTGNQEQTFGLDGKYNCHLLLGRDLPHKMTTVLSQELLQCMVSGERVCVPRKSQLAIEVKWTVPLLFASNQLPDYADNNGQVVRRLVPFKFCKPVTDPDPTLLQCILQSELPAILSKAMEAYLDAARQHGKMGFWRWCPSELLAAQKEVGIATSYVRRFLSLGPDDDEAKDENGVHVYTKEGGSKAAGRLAGLPGISTSISALKAAFNSFVKRHHHGGTRVAEVLDRATLELLGYGISEKNICKACSMHNGNETEVCCPRYSRDNRKKLICAVGLALVREIMHEGPPLE